MLAKLEELGRCNPSNSFYIMTLANINHFGLGVYAPGSPESYAEEIKWLELGVRHKIPEAMCSLAVNHLHGHGAPKDLDRACGLLQTASGQGYSRAAHWMDVVRSQQISSLLGSGSEGAS